MVFGWEASKAAENLRKHGVSFEEAASVLCDPLAITGADPDHSAAEKRLITFGMSFAGRLLVVSHTERGETVRIISARVTTKTERRIYEEG